MAVPSPLCLGMDTRTRVSRQATEDHLLDSLDVPAGFPFLGNAFGHSHGVAFDVSLVVVNNRPPVDHRDCHLFLRRLLAVDHHVLSLSSLNHSGSHYEVGNPDTRLIAPGRGVANARRVSAMYW